jgi:predicted enzyme related to lactoylglutathione lyase
MLLHALLFVSDVARMQAFYTQVFDLVAEPGGDADFVRLRGADGATGIALHRLRGDAEPVATPPAWREDSYVKLCFAVTDLDAARARVAQHGGETREPWTWEGRQFSEAVDPEGNRLQLVM